MSADAPTYFSQSYAEARGKFLAAAEAANLDVQPQPHPLLGRDGEPLALDVVRDGPADARALLILSSACHGVEGFCGSGVQTALLGDADFRAAARAAGVAVLYLHALNPWGFSWWRRTTHENVDLNRNFLDFQQPRPVNSAYAALAHLAVPREWPPTPEVQQAVDDYITRHGARAWQSALSAGQYADPEGLFYGGQAPTWSQMALRHVLHDQGRRCAHLGWIDLHTGLGPSGVGERIFACRDDAAALARARAWWGPNITSIYDGSSTSALLSGLMWHAAYQECPQAEYTGIALEFGTVPIGPMLDALRADQWLENHPEADTLDPAKRSAIKRQLRDAFYTDTDGWKQQILAQGLACAHQAVQGLASA
ncbi:M14 family metallopeptidase [Aquabacterium sp. OR-4]|uniref:M14 family metallopeptidase n=1 Tax=Aquabacterium sp. OR-4 TaxID=2978127 RepID=UPI0021B40E13|nr:M14 family metallopeptidase [Aquabacterium sp. OR-4]MDT7837526.1 M14 family metallopeptidase [Aquabacterium sp. OR-4]